MYLQHNLLNLSYRTESLYSNNYFQSNNSKIKIWNFEFYLFVPS